MTTYIDNNATVRNAGDVIRYHTRKVIHRQDVANHTWNVMRIYTERYGIPRAEVYVYILYHDVLEIVTGDIPFQIKRNVPAMKQASLLAEQHAMATIKIPYVPITAEERHRVKVCDLLEMREYAEIEIAYGNAFADDIIHNIDQALKMMNEEVTDDYSK